MAGVGTGGTVTGVGEYLKSRNLSIRVIAVKPKDSAVLSASITDSNKIQGIGASFIPERLNTKIYDEVVTVSNEDALETGRLIGHKEGVLVGISSGAALWAPIQVAKRPENNRKTTVVVLPDSGERYLYTAFFAAE